MGEPRRPNKQERANILLNNLQKWIAGGATPEQAIEKLTVKQYDFLIDCGIDLDSYLLTPQQVKAAKTITKAGRTCKPGGYNKQYPQEKQDLFNGIVGFLRTQGAEIAPAEKQNFRDLDFSINGKRYNIVLSVPRK